jgi:hypothetical protein
LVEGPNRGHIFGREPSNDYFIKILFLLSKWYQTKRFLWEFSIVSYVKLSSAVVAILVGVLKSRTQFWNRNTVTNLLYVLIYYILDNLIWLYFSLTPIEKSNRPIVYHVVRLPMRFKQGELKVSRHMYFE